MATQEHNKGAGPYSQSHPDIKRSTKVDSSGNPTRKPTQALPKDMGGLSEALSGVGGSRTITRGPVKRYFA